MAGTNEGTQMSLQPVERGALLSLPVMILLLGFPHVSETIYTPTMPEITRDLQTSPQLTEFSLSIYFIGFAIGVALWGLCSDLFGRRKSMLAGVFIYTISCLLLWTATTISTLLVLRFIQGLGASAGSVVTQTMIRDCYTEKKRHQMFSLVGGALAFTPAIGPFIGGILSMHYGWHANFMVLAIMGITLLLYCSLYLSETKPLINTLQVSPQTVFRQASRLLRDRNILTHVLFISVANGIVFGFYGEAPFLFINVMGFSPAQYGLFGLVLCISGLIASFVSHRWQETKHPQEIITSAAKIVLFGSLNLLLAAFFDLFKLGANVFQLSYIVAGIAVVFLGVGILISNSLSIALNDYKETVGVAGALFGFMYYLGIAFFMGAVSLFHNGTAYPMSILFTCYAILAYLGSKTLKSEVLSSPLEPVKDNVQETP